MIGLAAALAAIAGVVAGCASTPPTAKPEKPATIDNHVQHGSGALYDPLLQVGQTWRFRVTLVEHPHAGDADAAETRELDPVRCAVTSVRPRGVDRIACITCEPTDELATYPPPAADLGGTYLSTRDGLWKIEPSPDDGAEIEAPPADAMLLPATPTSIRRETTARPSCLDDINPFSVVGTLPEGYELYALAPWGPHTWCVTRVWGCHSTWSIECYRQDVGWIGGASRGYFDPAVPHWSEVRWGEAPPFPFGVSS